MTIDTDLYEDIGAIKTDIHWLKSNMTIVLTRTEKLDRYRERKIGWYAGAGAILSVAFSVVQFVLEHLVK